ncbi:MAG: ROK family transcriptional regulator, partial [Clostridia bacterium]
MTITNDLIERGLIKVAGIARGGTGKQPEMLDVVADCEYRVGVDIGRGTVRLVIVDLQDRVIFHTLRDAGKVEDEREFVDRLSQWILDSINESQV